MKRIGQIYDLIFQQLVGFDLKHFGDAFQTYNGNVVLTPFETTDEIRRELRLPGQRFLCQAGRFSAAADVRRDDFQ